MQKCSSIIANDSTNFHFINIVEVIVKVTAYRQGCGADGNSNVPSARNRQLNIE